MLRDRQRDLRQQVLFESGHVLEVAAFRLSVSSDMFMQYRVDKIGRQRSHVEGIACSRIRTVPLEFIGEGHI